jgi:hypothetical protein
VATRHHVRTALSPPTTGDEAFSYETGAAPEPVERGREARGGSTILDLEYGGLWGEPQRAFLVVPDAGAGPWPIVMYQHWLAEEPNANRQEFVDEGVELAGDGIASFHLQGRFPWLDSPSGIDADRAGVIGQLVELRRALDLVSARSDIDASRIVFVGHDFGGMYGALLAAVDPRVKGLVMLAAVPSWSDWFVPYWDVLGGLTQADYRRRMADLDPVAYLGRIAPRPILFQFAATDRYVSREAADAIVAAAGEPKSSKAYDADHELANPTASADRVAWLATLLQP